MLGTGSNYLRQPLLGTLQPSDPTAGVPNGAVWMVGIHDLWTQYFHPFECPWTIRPVSWVSFEINGKRWMDKWTNMGIHGYHSKYKDLLGYHSNAWNIFVRDQLPSWGDCPWLAHHMDGPRADIVTLPGDAPGIRSVTGMMSLMARVNHCQPLWTGSNQHLPIL